MKSAEIIIVGGGVMGSSTAYSLRKIGYEGRIIVFEKILFTNIHLLREVLEGFASYILQLLISKLVDIVYSSTIAFRKKWELMGDRLKLIFVSGAIFS